MKLKLPRSFLRLPTITPFPPGMTAAGSANFSLEALMSNANAYAEATVTIATAGTNTLLTTAQLLAKNVILTVGASGAFTITLPATSKILDALGPTMPRDGSFYFPLYISNRATTFTGTLTAADVGTTFAGPVTLDNDANGKWIIRVNAPVSASAHPTLTFTRISTCDAGGGGGGGVGTVTSVALAAPVEFTVSGSPITGSGTLTLTKAVETANTVWAGPTTGAAAVPTFRALVVGDIPAGVGTVTSITATTPIVATPSPITGVGVVSHAASGVAPATYGDATHVAQVVVDATGHVTSATAVAISGASGGTVTSVAMSVPSILSVAGSPITTAGTLAVTLATETANTVFAGPTSGGAATPTFRALVGSDIPANTKITQISGFIDGGGTVITAGTTTVCVPCTYAGTIVAYTITVDTGTTTVRTWKKATGTAIPTVADNINTSGVSLSSGTAIRSTTLSDFTTTAVAANDLFIFEITAGTAMTKFSITLEITRT